MIVTDRLHGVILGYLAGKTVLYFDNNYGKIEKTLLTSFKDKKSCKSLEGMGIYKVEYDQKEKGAINTAVNYIVKVMKKKESTIKYDKKTGERLN